MDIKASINNIKDLKEPLIFRNDNDIVAMNDNIILIIESLDGEILNQINGADEFTLKKYNYILKKINIENNYINCDPDELDRYYGAYSTTINDINLITDIMKIFNMNYIKLKSHDFRLEINMWNKNNINRMQICLIIMNK